MNSTGKRTLVIGGGGPGIGGAIARAFGDAGAKVVVCDVDAQRTHQASSQVGDRGFAVTAGVRSTGPPGRQTYAGSLLWPPTATPWRNGTAASVPDFLERLRDRIKQHCDDHHQPWPARAGYARHEADTTIRAARLEADLSGTHPARPSADAIALRLVDPRRLDRSAQAPANGRRYTA